MRWSGCLEQHGTGTPVDPYKAIGAHLDNACTLKDLSVPTSAFLCGVYTDRKADASALPDARQPAGGLWTG